MNSIRSKPVCYVSREVKMDEEQPLTVEFLEFGKIGIGFEKEKKSSMKIKACRIAQKDPDFSIQGMKYCKITKSVGQTCRNPNFFEIRYSSNASIGDQNTDRKNLKIIQLVNSIDRPPKDRAHQFLTLVVHKQGPSTIKIIPREKTGLKTISVPFARQISVLYLISEVSAIIARRCQDAQYIGILNFEKESQWNQIIKIDRDAQIHFGWINLEIKLISIILDYPNQKGGKMMVLDYQQKYIIWEKQTFYTLLADRRVDPDFELILDIEGSGEGTKIIQYRKVALKKLLMFLSKKNKLDSQYGNELIRKMILISDLP